MSAVRAIVLAAVFAAIAPQTHAQTWTERSIGVTPPRYGARMAFDAVRGNAVLFGGNIGSMLTPVYSAETWLWDGANWTKPTLSNSPSGRFNHAMAFDEVRGEVVLFGGSTAISNVNSETWVWNGTTWTQKTPPTSPSPRFGASMAWDPVNKVVLLFGGATPTQSAETWAWDGTNWTRQHPIFSPMARAFAGLAWDGQRQGMLLYGDESLYSDTWLWNGVNWFNKTPLTQLPMGGRVMVSHNGRVLRIGSGTSLWDGNFWLRVISGGQGPPDVSNPAVVYDPVRDRTLVVGGMTYSGSLTPAQCSLDLGNACVFPFEATLATTSVPAAGGAFTISVHAPAGCAWTAATSDSWIGLTPGGSTASGTGPGSIQAVAAPNTGALSRTGSISVGGNRIQSIEQAAPPCPSGSVLPAAGPLQVRNECSGVSWTVPASAFDRIAIRAIGRGSGFTADDAQYRSMPTITITGPTPSGSVLATAAPSSDVEPISVLPATGTFSFPTGGTYVVTLTLTGGSQGFSQLDWVRTGQPCAQTVQAYGPLGAIAPGITIPSQGGALPLLSVSHPPDCPVVPALSTLPTVVPLAPTLLTSGFNRFAPNASINYTSGALAGALVFGSTSMPFVQLANQGCSWNVAAPPALLPDTRTARTTAITSNCSWTASSSASWLQVFPLNGNGSTNVQYTAFANFGTQARSATLTIAGQSFTLTQTPATGTEQQRFVKLLYNNFFGRTPTDAEVDFQANSGLSRAQLASNFFTSQEFNVQGRFIAGLYIGILNRDPEFGGWLFQRNALATGVISRDTAIRNFLDSQEFYLRNGTLTDREFVTLLYRQILFRTPTTAEIDFQVAALARGLGRADLTANFLSSAEFVMGMNHRITPFLVYAALMQRDATGDEFQSAGAIAVAAAALSDTASRDAKLRDDLLAPLVAGSEFARILQ